MNPRVFPISRVLIVAFVCLVAALTVFGFVVRSWQPAVASEHGVGVDRVIRYLLVTTGAIFVIAHLALAWLLWRGSGKGPATYRPVSRRTELLWALFPVLAMALISEAGVLVIGRPVWEQLYGELPADTLEVEVVGKQFEWFVRYSGKDGTFGRTEPERVHEVRNLVGLVKKDPAATDDLVFRGVLRLPVGKPVKVRLRSHDVLHSFSIPAFRTKQDIIPGVTLGTQFTPTEIGEFEIACAELCGLGHYKMRGTVKIMPQEEFDQWLAGQTGWFE